MELETLKGPEKVAVLMLYLGEDVAADVFSHLTEPEILQIGQTMARLDTIPPDVVDGVLEEFLNRFTSHKGITTNGLEYVRRIVNTAVDEDRARRILRGIDTSEQKAFQRRLDALTPESLAALMKQEHPQTAAVIATLLGTRTAMKVLSFFPEEIKNDIIYRMASLEHLSPEVLDQVRDFIDREIQVPKDNEDNDHEIIQMSASSGIERVAELLNAMGRQNNEPILQSLGSRDPRLVEQIANKMFSFDDLMRVDDRGIQALLKEVAKDQLAIALKIADDAIKEKFFRNMSERAAEFLREDMDVMGPVRFKDVEAAQRGIIAIALKLEEEGKLLIESRDGLDME